MRSLIFSDAHLDAVTAGMRRIDDLTKAFDTVAEVAIAEKVDNVFFLGDLGDADCGSILIRVLGVALGTGNKLGRNGIYSWWIRGNHDVNEDGSDTSTIDPIEHAERATVIKHQSLLIFDGGIEICFLPFPTRGTLYDPDAYVRSVWPGPKKCTRVIMGHCTGIPKALLGSETFDMSRGAELPFPTKAAIDCEVDFTFNGHFHKRQIVEGGINIPGSLERLRFDEEHNDPGFLIAEIPAWPKKQAVASSTTRSKRASSSR